MDHMTFDEFKEVLAEDLKESLYTRGYEDVEIGFTHTNKANIDYEAMTSMMEAFCLREYGYHSRRQRYRAIQ